MTSLHKLLAMVLTNWLKKVVGKVKCLVLEMLLWKEDKF